MANEKRNWLGPYIPQGSFLRDFVQQAKLVYQLMLDVRVNAVSKLIPLAALAYIISPIDLVTDVVPVLGQMDDLAVLLFGFRAFLEFAPPDVVREHLRRLVQARPVNWDVEPDPPQPPIGGELPPGDRPESQ